MQLCGPDWRARSTPCRGIGKLGLKGGKNEVRLVARNLDLFFGGGSDQDELVWPAHCSLYVPRPPTPAPLSIPP